MTIPADLVTNLLKLAQTRTVLDGVTDGTYENVHDYTGGNIDDAFELGATSGAADLARDVLAAFNIEFIIPEA